MAKKKKDGKDEEKVSESEAKKPSEETEGGGKGVANENDTAGNEGKSKGKVKPVYKDEDKQSMYDELRADGKTDHQARQIVTIKSK